MERGCAPVITTWISGCLDFSHLGTAELPDALHMGVRLSTKWIWKAIPVHSAEASPLDDGVIPGTASSLLRVLHSATVENTRESATAKTTPF